MSYTSAQAKENNASQKLAYKCKKSKIIHRDYTNFAGSTVPTITKEQYKKAMKHYIEQGKKQEVNVEWVVWAKSETIIWEKILVLKTFVKKYEVQMSP